ncbi:MAG TPA: hypothetical protein VL752_03060 [Acidisoma sp.]|uniref:glucosamine inositolphosphorylceramide transferase family protein n=1 Tax=Acidisoma sp. TaxID=1872115 RepID=UPI002D0D4210|nr:hypothetical protein [Acidisoma sp.]HTH99903.1 hypothetical protein [Acidisoma sp.]
MLRPMDIWRPAIIAKPFGRILDEGIEEASLHWLPELPPACFWADPFGLWRDGKLHVFVERFDYHDRGGWIEVLVYDADLRLLGSRPVLREAWHLSYPFVFEAEGETWMLPEAFQSGTLTLYRARRFPDQWEPACSLPLDGPAIDATPFQFEGRWWLVYAPSHSKPAKQSHLHAAYADRLTGPWTPHPGNPVLIDRSSARPGGTPFLHGGRIVLPVQDCRGTYGAALRLLDISRLDATGFAAEARDGLAPVSWMAPYLDGMHTLSAAGAVSLIDAKWMDASLAGKLSRLYGIVKHKIARQAA